MDVVAGAHADAACGVANVRYISRRAKHLALAFGIGFASPVTNHGFDNCATLGNALSIAAHRIGVCWGER